MSVTKKSRKKPRIHHEEKVIGIEESSSDSSEQATICYGMVPLECAKPRLKEEEQKPKCSTMSRIPQEYARPRLKAEDQKPKCSTMGRIVCVKDELSDTSLTGSITRFRCDFDTFKCKMRVFGESLNLCRCLSADYKSKMDGMEKRLCELEIRHKLLKKATNYSNIILKNKILANKSKKDTKKLQMSGTEEEMREVAARICRNYLHGAWKTVDPKELDFRRISGGLSNFIYYVALPDETSKWGGYQKRESSPEDTDDSDNVEGGSRRKSVVKSFSFTSLEEPRKVLLRIYGQVHGERAMDAIVTESVIFTLLSERRLGPRLHGVFSGGRIEEYIPARPLLTKELSEPSLSMKIAEKMAAIHSMEVPLGKEPNWIWKTMYKWLKTVKEERLSGNIQGKNEEEQRIIKQLKETDLEKELEWLKKFLASVDSPVVFCHNDLQEGNILLIEDAHQTAPEDESSPVFVRRFDAEETLLNRECESKDSFERLQYEDANTSDTVVSHFSDSGEPKLVLIDFEYCAYNYRGFDIANHFQEWTFDYTNPEYPFYYEKPDFTPSLEQKEIFIREYLKYYHSNNQDKPEATLDDVNKLLDEVEAFACASHLFWTLWSIVNASKSQIPFGYWEYALARLENYLRLKQEVIKKDKCGLPQKRKICEVDI